jgi:hypothetical protein
MFKNVLLRFGIGIIASVTTLTCMVVPAAAENDQWVTIGKSNRGSILSLAVDSVQTKPHAGNWLWFIYKISNKDETQVVLGFTGTCVKGKVTGKPEWYVEKTNKEGVIDELITVKADSPGSQALLTKVCQISNSAKSALSPQHNQERESRVQLELDGCFRARIEAETELEAMQLTGGATIRNRQRLIESQYETCVRQAQSVD